MPASAHVSVDMPPEVPPAAVSTFGGGTGGGNTVAGTGFGRVEAECCPEVFDVVLSDYELH